MENAKQLAEALLMLYQKRFPRDRCEFCGSNGYCGDDHDSECPICLAKRILDEE